LDVIPCDQSTVAGSLHQPHLERRREELACAVEEAHDLGDVGRGLGIRVNGCSTELFSKCIVQKTDP
jgi:hypothetical protein